MKSPTSGSLHEALRAIPDGLKAEIIDGQLIVQSSPTFEHQTVSGNLEQHLAPRFRDGDDGPGGWIIVQDLNVYLPEHMQTTFEQEHVRPDVLGWRRDVMPRPPKGPGSSVVPTWICEVLSTNEKHDREIKMPIYDALGVSFAWLLDPTKRKLEIYKNIGNGWQMLTVAGSEDRIYPEPFEACLLDMRKLWRGIDI